LKQLFGFERINLNVDEQNKCFFHWILNLS
jgi:hypothetical protein